MKQDEKQKASRLTVSDVRRLLTLALPFRWPLFAASLLTLLTTAVSLSLPLAARHTLDQVLQQRQAARWNQLALMLVALILLGGLLRYAQVILVAYASNRIVRDLRDRLYTHLLHLPVAFFDQTRSGNLASHLSNDVALLQQTLTDDLVRFSSYVVTLVGGVTLTLLIDWRLTSAILTLVCVMLGICLLLGSRLRARTRAGLDALSETLGAMTETLSNIRLVKAFAHERHESRRIRRELDRVFLLNMQSSALEGALGAGVTTGFLLVLLVVVWVEGQRVLHGQMSAGSLLAFLMTLAMLINPMGSLASQYGRIQRASAAADRVFSLLDEAEEPPENPESKGFPEGAGRIDFEGVEFGYTASQPVLKDFSLNLPAGKVTALIGASGAGKTTIALLLYRFYTPQAGCISIDGVPIQSMQRKALRENIGIVPQESILFNGTIRENIRYGRLTASDEEVEEAGRVANVEEFVLPLEQGYETVIGERGITLSGGQRQRVAIARALLKNSRILILDEATSALDTHSEWFVRQALERLMEGRTTLVIAHRMTTIQDADQIAVLEGGRIAECGTHAELLSGHGYYASLQEWLQALIK